VAGSNKKENDYKKQFPQNYDKHNDSRRAHDIMKLSIETHVLHKRYGDKKAIYMLNKAGFDSIDYSYYWLDKSDEALGENYKEYACKVKGWLEENGMTCNQAHAPFDMQYGCKFDVSEVAYLNVVRAMESASIMGADSIIVHCIEVPASEDIFEYNLEFYKSLEPYCEQFGIKVAVENLFKGDYRSKCFRGTLFTAEHLNQMITALASPYFVVCIDLGHAAITGYEPQDLIKRFDNQTLKALHVQDTDYMDDMHTLPYAGKLNWNAITVALKEINYNSDFTFEIFHYLGRIDDELIEDALAFAAKTGRHLISKIIC
jgi:sugar phosphate isomerase/epimerase